MSSSSEINIQDIDLKKYILEVVPEEDFNVSVVLLSRESGEIVKEKTIDYSSFHEPQGRPRMFTNGQYPTADGKYVYLENKEEFFELENKHFAHDLKLTLLTVALYNDFGKFSELYAPIMDTMYDMKKVEEEFLDKFNVKISENERVSDEYYFKETKSYIYKPTASEYVGNDMLSTYYKKQDVINKIRQVDKIYEAEEIKIKLSRTRYTNDPEVIIYGIDNIDTADYFSFDKEKDRHSFIKNEIIPRCENCINLSISTIEENNIKEKVDEIKYRKLQTGFDYLKDILEKTVDYENDGRVGHFYDKRGKEICMAVFNVGEDNRIFLGDIKNGLATDLSYFITERVFEEATSEYQRLNLSQNEEVER